MASQNINPVVFQILSHQTALELLRCLLETKISPWTTKGMLKTQNYFKTCLSKLAISIFFTKTKHL